MSKINFDDLQHSVLGDLYCSIKPNYCLDNMVDEILNGAKKNAHTFAIVSKDRLKEIIKEKDFLKGKKINKKILKDLFSTYESITNKDREALIDKAVLNEIKIGRNKLITSQESRIYVNDNSIEKLTKRVSKKGRTSINTVTIHDLESNKVTEFVETENLGKSIFTKKIDGKIIYRVPKSKYGGIAFWKQGKNWVIKKWDAANTFFTKLLKKIKNSKIIEKVIAIKNKLPAPFKSVLKFVGRYLIIVEEAIESLIDYWNGTFDFTSEVVEKCFVAFSFLLASIPLALLGFTSSVGLIGTVLIGATLIFASAQIRELMDEIEPIIVSNLTPLVKEYIGDAKQGLNHTVKEKHNRFKPAQLYEFQKR